MIAQQPNVFSIAPGAPFLDVLARAVLDGSFGPGDGTAKAPGLEIAAATIYLPTRRAARALGHALQRASGTGVLLPHIAGLGEAGEEDNPSAFSRSVDGDDGLVDGAPDSATVSEAERRAVLADIAVEWSHTTNKWVDRPPVIGPRPVPRTSIEAAAFAIELAQLLDEMTIAGVGCKHLAGLVPKELVDLARNWEINLEFLCHARDRWKAHLKARHLIERVARRDHHLIGEAERLKREGSPAPVIAAGSTGSVPAAATLMRSIAHLDNGAVVLPGLDRDLDQRSWDAIGPEHPQFGIKRLIATIGVERSEVRLLGKDSASSRTMRARLVAETMRPAATADLWVEQLSQMVPAEVRDALSGVSLIEAADEHEEARTIALILRRAADQPDRLTALVTPDRTLSRRVSGELTRWRIAVDDSAGQPIASTLPGVFIRLVAEAAASRYAPLAALALLKHPLAGLGLDGTHVRHAARVIEIAAMRGARPAAGLSGLTAALESAARGERRHPVARRLTEDEFDAARDLLARMKTAFAPLIRIEGKEARISAADLITAHIEAAEALARTPEDRPDALWAGPAGEAMAAFLAEAISAAHHAKPIEFADFRGWLEQLMRARVVRRPRLGPSNIVIWGPLEARLQHVDRLILAGLNEGVWPAETETDPWLGRQMRERLGLDAPERRIGLQAHDVAQALHADEVILVRCEKSGGTPAVPSRWVWRLKTMLDAVKCADALQPADPWIGWARGLDAVEEVQPCAPPSPTPPVSARPSRLSVTRIETLLRDPYAIYARHILDLQPLDHLDLAPDAAEYGTIIHAALGRLIDEFPVAPLPADALARLLEIGATEFAALDDRPGLKSYWQMRFERVARWFVEADHTLRADGVTSRCEISGRINLPAPGAEGFILNARADRIDIDAAGGATIVDYKTGNPPGNKEIKALLAPQMPLEAAILAGGGFSGLGDARASELVHLSLTGREPPGEIRPAPDDPGVLADKALEKLRGLIAAYTDPARAYLSHIAPKRKDYTGDYDHLARVAEWSLTLGSSHGP